MAKASQSVTPGPRCKKDNKKTHKYSDYDTGSGDSQLDAYMSEYNGGGDSVTALGIRGATTVESVAIAQRRTDVATSLHYTLTQYYQIKGNHSNA
ncbi:hypothetical protein F5Y16DRAFT_371226 [Xylariaceae sp. FL0255]|nr:hypothetical protein F5Y16DRAFT_371226 [Xylariaceae sp. FL0255]